MRRADHEVGFRLEDQRLVYRGQVCYPNLL